MLLASELKRKHALESEAWRRAINGSDLLLMFMLKAADPATYERSQRVELTGPGGAPLELNDPARAARIAAILSVVVARKAKAAGTADGEVIEAEFIEVVALPSDCRDLL